ncbi:MAG: VOC family protein [Chitinophagaceae bacterium]
MSQPIIAGIQQVGIGVADADASFAWYRKYFGTDIVIFKDQAIARLMQQYTGNKEHHRYAILAMNLQSGGGIEIWQFTSRVPQEAKFRVGWGDLGINAIKIKSKNIAVTYHYYQENGLDLFTGILSDPLGKKHFYLRDPNMNLFEIVEDDYWFTRGNNFTGAVAGAVIGVSDMEQSLEFYQHVLGYSYKVFDQCGDFEDLFLPHQDQDQFRRVLLRREEKEIGAFSKLLGPSTLELLQVKNRAPKKIYENRYWGDPGFIHLCFDIHGLDLLESKCQQLGWPLSVNSRNTFHMGQAGGQFAYQEDPDGTLIEYVETHRLPILKKLGWYLNLKNRNPEKPLPDWIVKSLRFSRVKN